jgi:hypothetical protein
MALYPFRPLPSWKCPSFPSTCCCLSLTCFILKPGGFCWFTSGSAAAALM